MYIYIYVYTLYIYNTYAYVGCEAQTKMPQIESSLKELIAEKAALPNQTADLYMYMCVYIYIYIYIYAHSVNQKEGFVNLQFIIAIFPHQFR